MNNQTISPLAHIHPDAKIGVNVEIGAFAYIDANVEIGDNTKVLPNATIFSGARIGSNCTIHPGAVIAGIPQDLKFRNEETLAIVGDNVMIRECATVNRGTASRGQTVVGNNCLLMAYSHVAHDCVLKNNIIIGNATQLAGEVEIDDYAILSGGTLVHQFTKIGAHAMIQGGSKVGKDIPPYILVGRDPIAFMGINAVGLSRRRFSRNQMNLIQDIYRCLYLTANNTSQAVKIIETELPESEEKEMILDFIRKSERGIVRGNMDN